VRLAADAAWIAVSLKLGAILAARRGVMTVTMALSPDAPRPVGERAAPIRSAHDAPSAAARPPASVPRVARGV
jgi:hypothetical protein